MIYVMDRIIYIYHKDWKGECIIQNKIIYRKNNPHEKGQCEFNKNKLIIYWEKWESDNFFSFDNYHFYDYNINNEYLTQEYKCSRLLLVYKEIIHEIVIHLETNNYIHLEKNTSGKYKIQKSILYLYLKNTILKYKQLDNFIFIIHENQQENIYFYLELEYNNQNNQYIFNKEDKSFFNINNIHDNGKFIMDNNNLSMTWANNETKYFYSKHYIIEEENKEEENQKQKLVHIIKPNQITLDGKVLFSNITLNKHKIILTSSYYIYTPWNLDLLKINIPNNKILKKYNYIYDHYETSLSIIIELEYVNSNEIIQIIYEDSCFDFNLEQVHLEEAPIYAMTLFKDDYLLLKQYFKYYSNLGINHYLLYYNGNINNELIQFIEEINQMHNNTIYLMEWDYSYWWQHTNNPKHHHAQTMAINDSLNILKNTSKYILYNDLDEYMKINYDSFQKLIDENKNIDVFIFKCIFCKMTENKIKYNDFADVYDESKIIFGNYWDKFREKNLIKSSEINVMGVHDPVEKFQDKNESLMKWSEGIFYHYINFEEKYRPELMHQYIS